LKTLDSFGAAPYSAVRRPFSLSIYRPLLDDLMLLDISSTSFIFLVLLGDVLLARIVHPF
jgi:hypothetical protein